MSDDLSVNAVPYTAGFHRPHAFLKPQDGKPLPPMPKQAIFRFLEGGDWTCDGEPMHLDALLESGLLTRRPDQLLQDQSGEVYTQSAVLAAYWNVRGDLKRRR